MDEEGALDLVLYRSPTDDVYANLALEEYLLDTAGSKAVSFLLYRNADCAVMGKHQNPWREVDVPALRTAGTRLARRVSGGGTVYHDRGNLNFSFIMPKPRFDRRANLELIVRALAAVGIEPAITDRYDLAVGGRKFSGNAFCFRRGAALHHGTLLIEANLERIAGLLRGVLGPIATYAVGSHPSPVVNLRELQPRLSDDAIEEALFRAVRSRWREGSCRMLEEGEVDQQRVAALAERNASTAWLYGATPRFSIELAGGLVRLEIESGHVTGATGAAVRTSTLIGAPFDAVALGSALRSLDLPLSAGESALKAFLESVPF